MKSIVVLSCSAVHQTQMEHRRDKRFTVLKCLLKVADSLPDLGFFLIWVPVSTIVFDCIILYLSLAGQSFGMVQLRIPRLQGTRVLEVRVGFLEVWWVLTQEDVSEIEVIVRVLGMQIDSHLK